MTKLIDDGPNFSWFVSFLAVAKFNGYKNAADWMGIPQPTVSKRVSRLEKWLEQDLFTKTRPPKLTPYGRSMKKSVEKFCITISSNKNIIARYGKGGLEPAEHETIILRSLLYPVVII